MNAIDQINDYLDSQPEPKRTEMKTLHESIMSQFKDCALSFLDGKDEQGKVLTNPNIGYGTQKLHYADGSTKDFYQIGMSANTTGISIYIMGLNDKAFLPENYGQLIGKATVTGYCVKFKKLGDIHADALMNAVRDGIGQTSL